MGKAMPQVQGGQEWRLYGRPPRQGPLRAVRRKARRLRQSGAVNGDALPCAAGPFQRNVAAYASAARAA
ncbi:MAG: hypothetical protein R3F11_30795 [Verrucomicrobiales bacterium]